MEPTQMDYGKRSTLLARSLVEGTGEGVSMEIMNPTEEDVLLYSKTQMGMVSRVQVLPTGADEREENPEEIPAELQNLLERMDTDLDGSQYSQVSELLRKNQGIFAFLASLWDEQTW